MSSTEEPTKASATNGIAGQSKSSQCEDTLIFGSTPSHLFDEIAITIDNLLTEEVSALPLLPRSKNGDGDASHLSGEEILLAKLRKAYKKNLDVVEAYCSRNVFTIESFSKTKRRKVLEHFLNKDGGEEDGETAADNAMASASSNQFTSKFDPPAKNEELPTAQQIMDMDKEILLARQRLQSEKQRRVKLSRQMQRIKGAMDSLRLVQDAIKGEDGNGFDQLQQKIRKAMEGHQELKGLNERAEELIQMLDKIKEERRSADGGVLSVGDENKKSVTREGNEIKRRRAQMERDGDMGDEGDVRTHCSKEEIDSLLKKLREK